MRFLFFFIPIVLFSCNSTPTEAEQVSIPIEGETIPAIEETIEVSLQEDFEIIEEEEKELTLFQKAVQQQQNKDIFPQGVVLKGSDDIFEVEMLTFISILKSTENWFLVQYTREEGEIEEVYYFTFDFNGNQLDAKHLYTLAIDLNATVNFITSNEFIVRKIIDEVELDDNDDLKIISSKEKIEKYTISDEGKILLSAL